MLLDIFLEIFRSVQMDPIFEAFKFIFLFCRSMYRAELLYGVRALHASRRGSKVSCISRALISLPNKHLTRCVPDKIDSSSALA